LSEWQPGDAQIIVTAGVLPKRSSLRKLFEGSKTAHVAAIYDDPPGRAEIEDLLKGAGIAMWTAPRWSIWKRWRERLSAGDFRQTIDKLGLYKRGDASPVTPPTSRPSRPSAARRSLTTSSTPPPRPHRVHRPDPVAAEGAGGRARDALHRRAAPFPGAARGGLPSRRRRSGPFGATPPVFGPRRERLKRQVSRWGRPELETAISMLVETDMALRSSTSAPQMAMMERTLIRLAMLPNRGGR
jgi:DNA polymerase-3 subunit delta